MSEEIIWGNITESYLSIQVQSQTNVVHKGGLQFINNVHMGKLHRHLLNPF